MKVLIGMPDPASWGGVQACEPPFVAALRESGVLSVDEQTYVYGDKLRKTTLSGRIERVLKTGLRMRRVMRQGSYDVVHLNTAFDMKTVLRDLVTVTLMRGSGAAIFLKLHGSDRPLLETGSLMKRALWRGLLGRVQGIGVLSSEERDNFIRAGVEADRVLVVKNSVRLPATVPPRTFQPGPVKFLFVARFIPTKGLLESIRASAIVRDRGLPFTLHCIGDGEVRAEAESLVDALRLRDRVHFTGYIPEAEVDAHYATGDCLLFPTFHDEGFPMVIFNSMALGLPIITTRIRAARDYLRDPENCLWTEARSPEHTARQMMRMIEEPALRASMSRNNVESVRRFTAANVAPEYIEIYRRLARAPEPRAARSEALKDS